VSTIRLPVIYDPIIGCDIKGPCIEIDTDVIVAATGIPARLEAVERELRQHYHLTGGEPTSTGVAPGLQPEVDDLTPDMVAAIKEGCEQSRRGEVVERDFTAYAQPDADEAADRKKYAATASRLLRCNELHATWYTGGLGLETCARVSDDEMLALRVCADIAAKHDAEIAALRAQVSVLKASLDASRENGRKAQSEADMYKLERNGIGRDLEQANAKRFAAEDERDRLNADLAAAQDTATMWERRAIKLEHDPKADARGVIEEWKAKAERAWSECEAAKERTEKAEYERDVANKFIGHWSQECATARAERDAARAGLAEAVGVLRKAQRWASVSGPFDAADEAMWCRIDAILAKHPEAGAGEGK
jgi:hypothetical protein